MRKYATGLYGRTSKDDPRRVTIEIQQGALKDWASRDSLVDRVVDEYWDDGVTGKLPLWERPQGKRLLADIDSGRVQAVAVVYADRFGRTLLDGLNAVKLIEAKGVKLVAINDGWDARRDDSPMYFQFRMMMAEEEHRRICQRMRDGKARAMDRDNAPPGGPLTFGYRLDQRGQFVPDPAEAPVVIRMFEMALEGFSQADILRWVKTVPVAAGRKFQKRLAGSLPAAVSNHAGASWHLTKVGKILRNPTYLGQRRWAERVFPCMPLVDRETFDKVQSLLDRRTARQFCFANRGGPSNGLVSGLLTCGLCGAPFYHQKRSSKRRGTDRRDVYEMYVCDNQRRHGKCPAKLVRMDAFDRQVWSLVEEIARDPEKVVRKVVNADESLCSEAADLDRSESECLAELAAVEAEVAKVWSEQKANKWPMSWVTPMLNELNVRREAATVRLELARSRRANVMMTRSQSNEVVAALAKIQTRINKAMSAREKFDIVRLMVGGGVVQTTGSGRQKRATITLQLRWGESLMNAEKVSSRKLPKDWSYGSQRDGTLRVVLGCERVE